MIESLDGYREGLKAKVLERVPEVSIRALQDTPRPSWVLCEHDRLFVDAIVEELGYAGAVDCVRFSVARHFRSPLLQTVVKGAQRVFGQGPAAMLRMLPRAWGLVYRDLARPSLEDLEAHSATFKLVDVHPIVFATTGYRASFEALFVGIFDVTEHPGTVRMRVVPEEQTIAFELTWADRKSDR